MPYLFDSEQVYKDFMNDENYMDQVYEATDESGLRVMTWYNAGTRNFYAKKPIHTPDDLRGLKIRVQQSPASVAMANAFGAAAAPMGFGEVYTAIQQGVIDGAENNELALTNNKHGEVAKYFSYDMHQTVPDMLIANRNFINGLSEDELEIFKEAARISSRVGVEFIDVDVAQFREKVADVQNQMLEDNPKIVDIYHHVQEVNAKAKGEQ